MAFGMVQAEKSAISFNKIEIRTYLSSIKAGLGVGAVLLRFGLEEKAGP